jgi:hypothetical protein
MKTQLTEQELNFYNALIENYKEKSDNSFLERIYYAESTIDKIFEEFDFYFEISTNKNFLMNSLILYSSLDGVFVGKIHDFFWFIDKYGRIYLISKNIEDIGIQMLKLFSGLDIIQDPNLESFYYINEYKYPDFKDYLDEYRLFAKQYGYDFDLMKDIDDYEGIEKDVEEFNKLLSSYGIVNEEE